MIRTRAELLHQGIPASTLDDRCRRGELHRLLPGVYSLSEPSPIDRCHATLAWEPRAVLSHRTAAHLHGLLPAPDRLEATVPKSVSRRPPTWLTFHRRDLAPDWIGQVQGLADTIPALCDLGLHGTKTIRRQLRQAALDAASPAEQKFARALAQRNCPLPLNRSVGPYLCDFVDTRSRTVIEIDGRTFHSEPDVFCRDRRRQNALQLTGWLVLRYAARDVFDHPDRCAAEAVRAIRERRIRFRKR
ncbi:type IV toxin-antitoxin system AbiEi family antitoxin domain-containing protein [Nocardia huaxiensis]|uniref:type IV toxin-antitoxin system AbiEi family antitoxin domain-containing protein n=1 Tax=Nocardia huaxiensis TaxID=2755382 RepID=UPI001E637DC5|nr:type IV toxin-antitoxin system AbiEi family antitoxin domain-containing protein [Nocardia huaxiensis]UFS97225.1 DUF559 domain-containing protein [Nocardia huaxiensis]